MPHGTPTTSASTANGWPSPWRPDLLAPAAGPVAVSGAAGRLGRAVAARLAQLDRHVVAWSRPDYDLDDPAAAARLVARDRPSLIIHCAAWTDVDGSARDPQTAMRRNARAVRELAEAAAGSDAGLVLVSTNEVFDGRRTDGQGYQETDPVEPVNAYGASKLAGERAAAVAYARARRPQDLWVVRTAWLFGPGRPDFPAKILAAADALPAGETLPVVSDEVGSPTYAPDLAAALLELVARTSGGLYHVVNAGQASRAAWAAAVLAGSGRTTAVRPIDQVDFARPSTAPRWAVLATDRAAAAGVLVRPWDEALADRLGRGEPRS